MSQFTYKVDTLRYFEWIEINWSLFQKEFYVMEQE